MTTTTTITLPALTYVPGADLHVQQAQPGGPYYLHAGDSRLALRGPYQTAQGAMNGLEALRACMAACAFSPCPRPMSSPWGCPDFAREVVPGIWSVSTPSHGGLFLSAERMAALPPGARRTPYSSGGWFEEDCDVLIPIVAFPDLRAAWDVDMAEVARMINRDYYRPYIAAFDMR